MTTTPSTVEVYAGDDWTITGTIGGTKSLTDATVASKARTAPEADTVAVTFAAEITDAGDRTATLTKARADTADVPPGTYVYDLVVTFADGSQETFGGGSVLVVLPRSTR